MMTPLVLIQMLLRFEVETFKLQRYVHLDDMKCRQLYFQSLVRYTQEPKFDMPKELWKVNPEK